MASVAAGAAAAGAGNAAAAAPGGGSDEDGDVDALADDLEAHLATRDADGRFLGLTRRRRRPQDPEFPIIEAINDESVPVSDSAGGDGVSAPQYRTWLIRGPVRGWNDDGWRISTLTTARALATMPLHEVYVRSAVHLVPGPYVDETDFLASVRFVAKAATKANVAWDTTGESSSFRGLVEGQELDDGDVRLVLQRAAAAVRAATRRLPAGYVALVGQRPAEDDRVFQGALRALLRQRSVRAVADFRRKGAAAMRLRWQLLLRSLGAGTVALMRRILELNHGDAALGPRRRASRVRLSWGSTQMRLLPTRAQLREELRRAFDAEDRVPHFFFTRHGRRRELVRWSYIRGSSTGGIRRYRSSDGREKRLRSHTNTYWQQAGAANSDDGGDVSADEDGGVFFNNDNVETEGCYAPMEKDPEKIKQLVANSHSYLENEDGTGEERILAFGFGAVAALQRTLDDAVAAGMSAEDVAKSPPAVPTFAADGGSVRGKMITAFCVALAWPHLKNGRTHLVPLAYSLSGEKDVDKRVARAVRDMLQEVMEASFTVPTAAVNVEDNAGAGGDPDSVPVAAAQARATLQLLDEIQVCGTLTMPGV